jgi:putative holliday junction resolvase
MRLTHTSSRYTGHVRSSDTPAQEISESQNQRVRILGIDYGRSRIGLAIADAEAGLARPLDTLQRINRNEDMRRLREIARDQGVKQIVVGLPLRLDGTRGEMAEEAARFAARLCKQLGIPVEMVDERLTSWEAERLLEEQGGRILRDHKEAARKIRKPVEAKSSVDAVAAAVILKEYLERKQPVKESI